MAIGVFDGMNTRFRRQSFLKTPVGLIVKVSTDTIDTTGNAFNPRNNGKIDQVRILLIDLGTRNGRDELSVKGFEISSLLTEAL